MSYEDQALREWHARLHEVRYEDMLDRHFPAPRAWAAASKQLDAVANPHQFWRQKNGVPVEPKHMSTEHIENSLNMLYRNEERRVLLLLIGAGAQRTVSPEVIRQNVLIKKPIAQVLEAEWLRRHNS